jgi:hypothetical protein
MQISGLVRRCVDAPAKEPDRPLSNEAGGFLTAVEAPGISRGLIAAGLARGFIPRASGEPKARPLP